jgi:hypothetical protein
MYSGKTRNTYGKDRPRSNTSEHHKIDKISPRERDYQQLSS